jgi:hypothetical protein
MFQSSTLYCQGLKTYDIREFAEEIFKLIHIRFKLQFGTRMKLSSRLPPQAFVVNIARSAT